LLERAEDLQAIREGAIPEVWIDVSRGLDVESAAGAVRVLNVASVSATAPSDKDGFDVNGVTQPSSEAHLSSQSDSADDTYRAQPRVSIAEEMERAQRVCLHARRAVESIFDDARLGRTVDAEASLSLVDEIAQSVSRNPDALVSMARLRARDDYTYMHSVAVCALMVALAQQLGLPEQTVREAGLGGLMHDLGKALMPLEVLNKPGPLTPAEFGIMKRHPMEGWRLLRSEGTAGEAVRRVALHHHEKFDGSGYPAGQVGEGIDLMARMGAICDVYDAVTTDRPYKNRWDPAHAVRQMTSWKGHFDPELLQAFIKCLGIYPVGSLVRLSSQRLAVVSEQNHVALLNPVVQVFFSVRSGLRMPPQRLDLADTRSSDRIVGIEDTSVWKFQGLDSLWRD
jgi:putative nucleotidyltransferase with HDIG domain